MKVVQCSDYEFSYFIFSVFFIFSKQFHFDLFKFHLPYSITRIYSPIHHWQRPLIETSHRKQLHNLEKGLTHFERTSKPFHPIGCKPHRLRYNFLNTLNSSNSLKPFQGRIPHTNYTVSINHFWLNQKLIRPDWFRRSVRSPQLYYLR